MECSGTGRVTCIGQQDLQKSLQGPFLVEINVGRIRTSDLELLPSLFGAAGAPSPLWIWG